MASSSSLAKRVKEKEKERERKKEKEKERDLHTTNTSLYSSYMGEILHVSLLQNEPGVHLQLDQPCP
jgi:hypothetical protein